jgi:hypothetical protein
MLAHENSADYIKLTVAVGPIPHSHDCSTQRCDMAYANLRTTVELFLLPVANLPQGNQEADLARLAYVIWMQSIDSGQSAGWQRTKLAATTFARYFLALGMIPYAVNKILRYQFQVSAWSYAQSLNNTPGTMLTWAMMGFAPWFQALLGVVELVPAVLLLNARTRRIGALLMFPVVLNVALINFALHLWFDTRIISAVLLAVNLFLLLIDFNFYRSLAGRLVVARPAKGWTRITGGAISIAVIATFLWFNITGIASETNSTADFIGLRQINGAGTWKIDALTIGGQEAPHGPHVRFFFDFQHRCVFGNLTDHSNGTFTSDRKRGTFEINGVTIADSSSKIAGTYTVEGDLLKLVGTRDNQPVIITLQRDNWGPQ